MELRAFAERILFSASLADKLAFDTHLTDAAPGPAIQVPDLPGRPPELGFGRDRVPFPHAEKLESATTRGQVLHFFANHELLALELMALVLLRFPDAEPRFRRGLAATMRDEQRHLAAYLERMKTLGVELGALGLSDFFWTALKATPSPLHFVAGMSLTLEQANLDFMRAYGVAFQAAGDGETSEILASVLEDEVRHVRHGHRWFERWRTRERSAFEVYRELILHPLTPARARGRRFDRESRQRAGLEEDFIDQVFTFRASKGRPPLVHLPNFDAEDRLALKADVPVSATPSGLIADLAPLLMFLAHEDDVVLLPRAPRTAFLAELAAFGFPLAEVIVGSEASAAAAALKDRPPAGFAPWADTQKTKRVHFDKVWAAQRFGAEGERAVAHDFAEAFKAAQTLFDRGHRQLVIKAGLSAAGRHRIWCDVPPSKEALAPLLERGPVVVEPWRDRVLDLGVLIDTRRRDPVLGILRFLTDGRGQYKGHVIGLRLGGLGDEIHQALFRPTDGVSGLSRLEARAKEVAAALRAEGHEGPASVDAMLHRSARGLVLDPVVEVNPRRTMGFIARALERHLAPRRAGLWLHLSKRDAKRLGYGSFSEMAAAFRRIAPAEWSPGREQPSLERGVLFTTDPETSQQVVTVLIVAEDLGMADRLLGQPSMLRSIQAVFS